MIDWNRDMKKKEMKFDSIGEWMKNTVTNLAEEKGVLGMMS